MGLVIKNKLCRCNWIICQANTKHRYFMALLVQMISHVSAVISISLYTCISVLFRKNLPSIVDFNFIKFRGIWDQCIWVNLGSSVFEIWDRHFQCIINSSVLILTHCICVTAGINWNNVFSTLEEIYSCICI